VSTTTARDAERVPDAFGAHRVTTFRDDGVREAVHQAVGGVGVCAQQGRGIGCGQLQVHVHHADGPSTPGDPPGQRVEGLADRGERSACCAAAVYRRLPTLGHRQRIDHPVRVHPQRRCQIPVQRADPGGPVPRRQAGDGPEPVTAVAVQFRPALRYVVGGGQHRCTGAGGQQAGAFTEGEPQPFDVGGGVVPGPDRQPQLRSGPTLIPAPATRNRRQVRLTVLPVPSGGVGVPGGQCLPAGQCGPGVVAAGVPVHRAAQVFGGQLGTLAE